MNAEDRIAGLEAALAAETDGWRRVGIMCGIADALRDRDPLKALGFADLAYAAAEGLKPASLAERAAVADAAALQADLRLLTGDTLQAMYRAFEALALLQDIGVPDSRPRLFITLSSVYRSSGSFNEALSWALRGLSAARKAQNRQAEADALVHVGVVHNHMGEFELERDKYEEAIRVYRETGDRRGEATTLNNIGVALHSQGDMHGAAAFAFESIQIARQEGLETIEATALGTLADVCLKSGRFDEAREHALASLEIARRIGFRSAEMNALLFQGMALDSEGDAAGARRLLLEALAIAERIESMEGCAESHEALAASFRSTGEFETALTHHEKFHSFRESMFNQETEGKLRVLRVLHGAETARMEAEALRREKELLENEISRRERAEKALIEQSEALKKRNEELDSFAHTVAHDLKNPLASLVTGSEFLERTWDSTEDEVKRHIVRSMRTGGAKMVSIIDELLLLSAVRGQHTVQMRALDMADVVGEALKWLDPMINEAGATLLLPESWQVCSGHEAWVEEVWVNYVSNAVKYAGPAPRVELGSDLAPDGSARFWVRDDGPGLSQDEMSRLFLPFERLHQVHVKGHGLGLSIVRRIIEKHGGQVGVESPAAPSGVRRRPGSGPGCLFFFTLPAAHQSPSQQAGLDGPTRAQS